VLFRSDESKPILLFTITDEQGQAVHQMSSGASAGLNRLQWDLRYHSVDPIRLPPPSFYNPFGGRDEGTLVPEGTYKLTMSKMVDGELTELATTNIEVKWLDNKTIPLENPQSLEAFRAEVADLSRSVQGAQRRLSEMNKQLKYLQAAAKRAKKPYTDFAPGLYELEQKLTALGRDLNGDPIKSRLDQSEPPSIAGRIGWISYEMKYSSSSPTETHQNSLRIAKTAFPKVVDRMNDLENEMENMEQRLEAAGAPYTPGRSLD